MRIDLTIIVILLSLKVVGQIPTTFVKRFTLNGTKSDGAFSHKTNNDDIYVNVASICNLQCSNLARLNIYGDILWSKNYPWTGIGNRNTINFEKEVIYLSGQSTKIKSSTFNVIKLDKDNGDSLNHYA
jgi:hypothetical protein